MISIQSLEGEFDLSRTLITRITAQVDSSKIFFLDALNWFWDQWENRFLAGVTKSLGTETFMVELISKQKKCLQHDDLWFDIKMHCAKSCKPFELFANENCKL